MRNFYVAGITPSTGRDAGRGKAAYIWISPDPVKAGPTLGGGVVAKFLCCTKHIFTAQSVQNL